MTVHPAHGRYYHIEMNKGTDLFYDTTGELKVDSTDGRMPIIIDIRCIPLKCEGQYGEGVNYANRSCMRDGGRSC